MTNNPVKKSKTPFFHASRPMAFGILLLGSVALYILLSLFGAWYFNKFLRRRFQLKGWIRALLTSVAFIVILALPFYGEIVGNIQLAYYKDKYPPMSEVYKTVHSDSYVVIYEGNTYSSVNYPTVSNKNAYIYIYVPSRKREFYYTKKDGKRIDTTDVLSKSRYHIYLTSKQITDRLEVREQRIINTETGETLGLYRDLKVNLGKRYSEQGGVHYKTYPSYNGMRIFNQKVIFPLTHEEDRHEPNP